MLKRFSIAKSFKTTFWLKVVQLTLICLVLSKAILSQTISIEFIDSPVSYPVGQLTDVTAPEGVFKHITQNLNKDSIRFVLRQELSKYPKGLLEKRARLAKIILTDTILISDENGEFTNAALGTYVVPARDGNIVFLDVTESLFPAILHHEISSVILYELATSDSVFRERTDKMLQWFYLKTPYYKLDKVIREVIQKTDDWPELKNNYFVLCNNGYALMDAENDFNEIVKCLFNPKLLKANHALLVDPKLKLWDFLDEAKKYNYEVYKKVMMVIDYYHSIHPSFTEAYFKALEN